MDPNSHRARVSRMRQAFAEANGRLVARLRACDDRSAETIPATGGWSAAQIGWHVARVTTTFAGLLSGHVPGVQPLPDGFHERAWAEVVAGIPSRLQALRAVVPPGSVRRLDAVRDLEASATQIAAAFDALTQERGGSHGMTHPIVGTISAYQIGEWAIAHVIRHNKQAKEVLAALASVDGSAIRTREGVPSGDV